MWAAEILTQLDVTNIGIICVTPENMGRPWLSFEAGALAKRIGTARVVPFLFGMTKNDWSYPGLVDRWLVGDDRLRGTPPLERGGGQIPQRGMPAVRVVEPFDVIE